VETVTPPATLVFRMAATTGVRPTAGRTPPQVTA